jgi:3-oxoacyl-[acyl-carrier protein] reductase
MRLDRRVALITGGGRGIGKAIALAMAGEGARIVVSARTASEIDDVAGKITAGGGTALAVSADMKQEDQVRALADRTMEEFGRIDILVNNAGIGHFAGVASLAPGDFDEMWNVNMRGVFLLTSAVLPRMISQNGGDIVNIASLAGRNAFAGGAGYAATKWALIGFSRCLMLEVREHNIRVVTLCPGSVATDFAGPSRAAKKPGVIPTSDDIARVALDAVAMPRNVMVSEIDIRPTNPKG